jgi:hypothetical protein
MNSRQFQLSVISLVLIGPFVTLIALMSDIGLFFYFLFPITIDSFNFWKGEEIGKELSYFRFIVPLFMMKIFIIGVISWIRLVRKRHGGALLTRFYVLTLAVSSIKLIAFLFQIEVNVYHFAAVAAFVIWIVMVGLALKKHRATSNLTADKAAEPVEQEY